MTEPEHPLPSPEPPADPGARPEAGPAEGPEPPGDPDAFSAVLGNATLLGLGYLLVRRPQWALAAAGAALALVALIALFPHVTAWRVLLGLVWAGAVVHAWRLARHSGGTPDPAPGGAAPPRWRTRVLTGACVLLVALAWLRLDAWAITRDAEAAHTAGDCDRALASLRWLLPAHGIAHGPAADRGVQQRQACELLTAALSDPDPSAAAEKLERYLAEPGALWDGAGPERAELLLDTVVARAREQEAAGEALGGHGPAVAAVEDAFTQLARTLEDAPGQSGRVGAVAESFLSSLDGMAPCRAREIDGWLLAQDWEDPALARVMEPQAEQAPVRMFDCAEALASVRPEEGAGAHQEFLAAHPEHPLAARSAESLIATEEYCAHPAAFPAAPAYEGEGPHAMRVSGLDPEEYGFPDSWRADTVEETVLVVCVQGPERGSFQRTCAYEPGEDQLLLPFSGSTDVDFYASAFTLQAYELHSGELVEEYTEEIGDPCPEELEYESYFLDIVPGEYDSDYSAADVRGMFDRLMD